MYNDIPDIVLKVKFYDAKASLEQKKFEEEFSKFRLGNGLLPDEHRNSMQYFILNRNMNLAIKGAQNVNRIALKDKAYIDYRKKWRHKTMMQPSIQAVKRVVKHMFDNKIELNFNDFSNMYVSQLKEIFIERHGESI